MSVGRQVTRLATGLPPIAPGVATFAIPLHIVQDQRQSEDLPFGSRGGIAVRYDFPVDGQYVIKIRLLESISAAGNPSRTRRFTTGTTRPRMFMIPLTGKGAWGTRVMVLTRSVSCTAATGMANVSPANPNITHVSSSLAC